MSAALLFDAMAGQGDGSVSPPPYAHAARDVKWVARIRRGEESAFERLFRAYVSSLLRFANSYIDDPAVAQEVVDDVFYAIWQRHTQWDPGPNVVAYLFTSVRHRALNALRTRQRQARQDDLIRLQPYEVFAPVPEAESESERVARILAVLPAQRRRVMLLRWCYELSPDEIAAALGMTRNAVYLALSRSLDTLRQIFATDVK